MHPGGFPPHRDFTGTRLESPPHQGLCSLLFGFTNFFPGCRRSFNSAFALRLVLRFTVSAPPRLGAPGESKSFLKGYWRNKQQSQPAHIEIFAEKLTVQSILVSVARNYPIPLTITRGMSSPPPKKEAVRRYVLSGKSELILLVVADLDPAGDAIAEDLVKSFRRDFEIQEIKAYKVAMTIDQVRQYGLAPSMKAKEQSPTYHAFVERYGIEDAYELEAMEPAHLANTLSSAIEDVLDIDLYNQELAAEENDAAQIVAVREQAEQFFKSLNLG